MKRVKEFVTERHSMVRLIVLLMILVIAGLACLERGVFGNNGETGGISIDKLIKDGQAAEKNGKKVEAIKSYEKVLEKDPTNSKVRSDLSMLYYQNKQYDKSSDSWNEVLKANPTDSFVLNAAANSARDQGKTDEAIKYYLQAIDNGNLDSAGNLITVYNSEGKFTESIALLNTLIEKYPEDVDLKKLLASTYSKSGNSKKAKEILSDL